MNKSTTIRICGHDVTLKFTDPDDWAGDGMGRASEISSQILLRPGMPPCVQCATLLHELFHMIFGIHGMPERDNELVVSVLAASMLDFLRSNPKLAKAIAEVRSIESTL